MLRLGQVELFAPNDLELHLITAHGVSVRALADARAWCRKTGVDYDAFLQNNLAVIHLYADHLDEGE